MQVEEQHRRDFHELRFKVHGLDERLSKEKSEVSTLELRVTQLERDHTAFQEHLVGVQLHAEDLENRSCRKSLRIRWLSEATGPENLQATLLAILHRVLAMEPTVSLEFDRVHWALGT